jgi:PKD domain
VRDRLTGTTELVSRSSDGQAGDRGSGGAAFLESETRMAVSAAGRFVAFNSEATNLVYGDFNARLDVFVRDRQPGGPIVDPGGPYLGWATAATRPAFVTFDASGSLDPIGATLVAHWDVGDGTPVIVAAIDEPVSHAYGGPGIYTVTRVVSAGGIDSAPVTTVAEILPAPGVPAMRAVPGCGQPGDLITLAIEHRPLVSPAGGWNLGRARVPTMRSVHPGSTIRLGVADPGGEISATRRGRSRPSRW